MTHFEYIKKYIKNMKMEEIATLINRIGYFPCECCEYNDSPGCGSKCVEGIKKFLESEMKQND